MEVFRLVCRISYTFGLPAELGVVYSSLIPIGPRIIICTICSIALIAACNLVQDGPEVVSSRKVARYPVSVVLERPAAEDHMSDGLASLSAIATRAVDAWHVSAEEDVLSPIFSDRSCTSSALLRFLSPEHFLGRHYCGSRLATFGLCPRLTIYVLSVCVSHHLFNVDSSGVVRVAHQASARLQPSSLHPVAS